VTPRVVLTVAGTDSGGGAVIAADLATFAALGVHGACVVTAVTAQDSLGVYGAHVVPTQHVAAQLAAIRNDLPLAAVKTGMLATPAAVRLVAQQLADVPLVVDPVLAATSGAVLADTSVLEAYLDDLFPVATVITPNAREARTLLGVGDEVTSRHLAAGLTEFGPAVVVTGGPEPGRRHDVCTDWLALPGQDPRPLRHAAVDTTNDHGTGCTFSAALAVGLAHGDPLARAVTDAAEFTARQLRSSRTWTLGRGRGPISHLIDRDPTDRKPE